MVKAIQNARLGVVIPGGLGALFIALAGAVDSSALPFGLFIPLLIASFLGLVVLWIFERYMFLLVCAGMLPVMVLPGENVILPFVSYIPLWGIAISAISLRSDDEGLGDFPPLLIFLTAGYLFVSILSGFFGPTYGSNFLKFFVEAGLLISAFVLFHKTKRRATLLRDLLLAVAAGATLVLVYSTFFSPWPGKRLPFPFFEHANYFGSLLAMLLPVLFWMATRKRGVERIIWAALGGVFLLAVLLFQSRGAWIGLAGGVIFGLLYYLRSKVQKLALVVAAVSGAVALWVVQPKEAPEDPSTTIEKIQSITDTQHTFSNRERITRWKCALRIFQDDPLWGCGPYNYHRMFKFYLEDWGEVEQISYWHGWEGQAHSEYLTRLSERGILGFLAFMGLLVFALLRLSQFQRKKVWGRTWTALVAASLGVWLVHGLVDDLSGDVSIWFLVAVILGASAKGKEDIEEPPSDPEPPKSKMKPKYMHNPNPVQNFSP